MKPIRTKSGMEGFSGTTTYPNKRVFVRISLLGRVPKVAGKLSSVYEYTR